MVLRLATVDDAEQIAKIYEPFVLATPVSFEHAPPTAEETAKRIADTLLAFPWLVMEDDGIVCGYAYAGRHRVRYHYQWSVDVSVYVRDGYRQQGIARRMYTALLQMLPMQGYINAFAGITLPNPASVTLHESMGFNPIGVYEDVGYKLGSWHSVGWWQRRLADPPSEPTQPLQLGEVSRCQEWRQLLLA